jgi:hypothetical protein
MFSIAEFRYWPEEKRIKYLEDLLNGDQADKLFEKIMDEGHGYKLHSEQSPDELLERTMREMHSTTSFLSKEDAKAFVDLAIYLEREQIADWLVGKKRSAVLEISCCMNEEVGVGIDTKLREKSSQTVTVVLERDMNMENDFGFFVKTAYPDIRDDRGVLTGETYEKEAAEKANKMQSELCRGYWNLRLSGHNVYLKEYGTDKALRVYFKVNNDEFRYKVSGRSSHSLKQKVDDQWMRINIKNMSQEIQSVCENINKIYNEAANNVIEFDKSKRDKFAVIER